MKCPKCDAEILAGFSECFSCGASLPPIMARANSPYHESISNRQRQNNNNYEDSSSSSSIPMKSKHSLMDEYFAKDLELSPRGSKRKFTSYLNSPSPSTSAAYVKASSSSAKKNTSDAVDSLRGIGHYSPPHQSFDSRSLLSMHAADKTPYEAAELDETRLFGSRNQNTSSSMNKNAFLKKSYDEIERDITAERKYQAESTERVRRSVQSPTSPPKRWSKFERGDTTTRLDINTGVWNPEDELFPWRNNKNYVQTMSSPYASASSTDDQKTPKQVMRKREEETQQHNNKSSPSTEALSSSKQYRDKLEEIIKQKTSATPKRGVLEEEKRSVAVVVPSSTSSSTNNNNAEKNRTSSSEKVKEQAGDEFIKPAELAPETARYNYLANHHQQHDDDDNNNNINNSTIINMMPFQAHAAAFMIEMYASNLHEQMLSHRNDLMKGMSSILRERVAFENAANEIRKAETFAAKAGAIRSMESSKLSQENADLRFELEEAYAAVERQKQITESVSQELAEMKAQYETSQITFQSLGSPLANQQQFATSPHQF